MVALIPNAVFSDRSIRETLKLEGLDEFSDLVMSRLARFQPILDSFDKRALLEELKLAGIVKMGQRQKIAAVLSALHSSYRKAVDTDSTMNTDFIPISSEDFWASIGEEASAVTSVECLPQDSGYRTPDSPAESHEGPTLEAVASDEFSAGTPAALSEEARRFLDEQLIWERVRAREREAQQQAVEAEQREREQQEALAQSMAEHDARSRTSALVVGGLSPEVIPFESRPIEERAAILRVCGNQSYARGDLNGAEIFYRKVLELDAHQPDALNNLGACCLSASPARPVEALDHLSRALKIRPHHAKTYMRIAKCHLMLGAIDDAIANLEASLTVERPPQPPRLATAELSPSPAAAQPTQADPAAEATPASSLSTDVDRSADSALLRRARDELESLRVLQARVSRGRALAVIGQCEEAVSIGRELMRTCAHSTIGEQLVAAAYEGSGQLRLAEAEVKEALSKAPEEAALRLQLARVAGRQGRVAEASQLLEALVEETPEFDRALRALDGMNAAVEAKERGNEAYRQGRFDEAVEAYSRGLEVDTEGMLTPLLLANRAQAHLKLGCFEETVHDCSVALKLDCGSHKLLHRRAAASLSLGCLSEARRDYERVLTLEPSDAAATDALRRLDERSRSSAGGGTSEVDDTPEGELDPYAILGVPHNANFAQIKAAYRKAILQWHPDKYTGEEKQLAAARFHKIKMANNILSDAHKRGQLDAGISTADALATDEKQDQWNKDYEYYSQSCPNGYKRDNDIGQRRWNPTAKVSATFDVHPCRFDPHVLQRDNAAAAAAQKVIHLKGPSTKALDNQRGKALDNQRGR